MIAEKMVGFVKNSSVIRAMFEEGKKMAAEYGAENVYDFSLGNPSVEPPVQVKEAILSILTEESPNLVHGYMSNSGFEDVRIAIADSLNQRFDTKFQAHNLIMTVGAAGGLNVIFKTLLNPGEEVITFSPFFGEYRNYVNNYQGVLVEVPANSDTFQPDLKALEAAITPKTKGVIVNTPNNPTGVVYSLETIQAMSQLLTRKGEEYHTDIYLISDEPYREIVYDGLQVPYLTKYYKNTIVGYSYSKSLSLPGERIGYLVIPDEVADAKDVIEAANVANRILGYVNAPSLMQRVVARCLDAKVDVATYAKNRDALYGALTEYGYECAKPQGAFYLFIKTLPKFQGDDVAFAAAAKKHNILIVPGSSFGCKGYCRLAYCVDYDMILRALPGFLALAEESK